MFDNGRPSCYLGGLVSISDNGGLLDALAGARRSRRRPARAGSGARLELAGQRFGPHRLRLRPCASVRSGPASRDRHRRSRGRCGVSPGLGDHLLRRVGSDLGEDGLDRDGRRLLGDARPPRLVLGETRAAGRRARHCRDRRARWGGRRASGAVRPSRRALGLGPAGLHRSALFHAAAAARCAAAAATGPWRGARASASTRSGAGRRSGSTARRASAAAGRGRCPSPALTVPTAQAGAATAAQAGTAARAGRGAGAGDGGQATRAAQRSEARASRRAAAAPFGARAAAAHPVRGRAPGCFRRRAAPRSRADGRYDDGQREGRSIPPRPARAQGTGSHAGSGVGPRPPARGGRCTAAIAAACGAEGGSYH